ncbi:PLP-dependent transferase [Rhizodiscina lignyota]|uniref:PLP-dependent transferase n=1 Tax=Rhizodiscina lignyota TaxID=1504668 RepID=A0A9P4I5X7_9PEZI|nr:PLP-dependent transferase [Rhizodiscina lignyota]
MEETYAVHQIALSKQTIRTKHYRLRSCSTPRVDKLRVDAGPIHTTPSSGSLLTLYGVSIHDEERAVFHKQEDTKDIEELVAKKKRNRFLDKKMGLVKDAMTMAGGRITVTTQDFKDAYSPCRQSHKAEKYQSLSKQGDWVHYVLEPFYENRIPRVLVTDAGRVVGYRNLDRKILYKINAASNSYSSLIRLDENCLALEEKALKELMPQASHTFSRKLVKALEGEIAEFVGDTYGMVTSTGYTANVAAMIAITGPRTIWLLDSDSHNSMITSARAAGALRLVKFENNNFEDLEDKLRMVQYDCDEIIVGIEGLYSMSGYYPNLHELAKLKQKYNFTVFCDECHSFLTLGREGRGILEHSRYLGGYMEDIVDIRTSGLAKSAGALGGYIGVKTAKHDKLIRGWLNEMVEEGTEPVPLCSVIQTLYWMRCIKLLPPTLKRLHHMSNFVRQQLKLAGFKVFGHVDSPIVAIHVGYAALAAEMTYLASQKGLTLLPVVPPAVPKPRIRLCLSAALTDEDITNIVRVVVECGLQTKLIAKTTYSPLVYQFSDLAIPISEQRIIKTKAYNKTMWDLEDTETTSGEQARRRLEYDGSKVAEAGRQALHTYGVGSGSARLLNGTFAPHINLEETLGSIFGGMHAILFNDTRIALMSTVNALSRPLNGFRQHVVYTPADAPKAITEGLNSARRDASVHHMQYDTIVGLIDQVKDTLRENRSTAFTVLLQHAQLGNPQHTAEAFEDFVLSISKEAQKYHSKVTVFLDNRDGITFQGDRGLGVANHVSLKELSQKSKVHLVVFGSFHKPLQLPGAFVITNKHLAAELRFTSPGYLFTTSAPPMLSAMAANALGQKYVT